MSRIDIKSFESYSKLVYFVINNCDCTNIVTLAIYEHIKVDKLINLKQFADKFTNLQRLIIEYDTPNNLKQKNGLLFLESFQSVCVRLQNKLKIELFLGANLTQDDYSYLSKIMDKNKQQGQDQQPQFEIEKLHVRNKDHYYFQNCDDDIIINFIKKCDDNFGLKCLGIYLADSFQKKFMKQVLFKSIKFLAIYGAARDSSQIKHLIDFLSLDVICDKKLFVSVYDVRFSDCRNKSLWDQLCQAIYQLLTKQIPIDIFIIFEKFEIADKLDSKLCFETDEFLSQYKKPQCDNNPFCSSLEKPLASFSPFCVWQSGYDLSVLQVSNCH